jgi:hypothetical protein
MQSALALLCLLCLAQVSASQPEPIRVSFVDETGTGSPIKATGQISLREVVAANQLGFSWGEKVLAKNISSKPVLLLVTSLTEVGRHSRGALRGPGDGPTYMLSDDRFFNETVIQPDEVLVLRDTTPDKMHFECCVNPLARDSEPKAVFRVRFVQFVDGSSFGDPAEANDDLELRAMIFAGLRKLAQSYRDHGDAGFLAEMKRDSPWSATLPLAAINTRYKQDGVAAGIACAQQILGRAERHEASIRSVETK